MILVAVGSNLNSKIFGSPLQNCEKAIEFLEGKFQIEKVSNFYETEPMPISTQPMYVNAVISIKTELLPNNILEDLLSVENIFKRVRTLKNEARVIDLDLLCYNELILNTKKLKLPHPRMHLRKFVMQPVCDINPDWVHPLFKTNAKNLIKNLANQKICNIS